MQYKIEIYVGYDTEKEADEAYARLKAEAAKAVPCKYGPTRFQKHKCYNDEMHPKPCEILEDDIEAVNTLAKSKETIK